MKNHNQKTKARIKKLTKALKVKNWSLSQEREFTENLFVGRFNYFLVVFSLFFTASFTNGLEQKFLPFYLGTIMLLAVWIPLFRAFKKHDRTIKLIFNDKPNHPTSIVEEILHEEGHKPFFVVSRWMGIYIPGLCLLFLVLSGLATQLGWIK